MKYFGGRYDLIHGARPLPRTVSAYPKEIRRKMPSTPEEKLATLMRIYGAWCRVPEQRLGQVIMNAVVFTVPVPELFYREDNDLALDLERFVSPEPAQASED